MLEPAKRRRLHGLGRAGFAIVAVVALINALNTTTKYLVTEPFAHWSMDFLHHFVNHALVGVGILLAAVWARNRVPARGLAQVATVFVAVVLGAAAALIVVEIINAVWVTGLDPNATPLARAVALGSDLVRYAFVGLVIASAWLYVRAEADHAAATDRCLVDSERMDRQTAEARLRVLEAQIEPHFLFNTLAHVRRLYETDPAAGAQMLRNLKDYLAVALPQMRTAESTLGREVDHVVAYLNIQQIRMGRRLAFDIDVPGALRDARMPPLMLLTLVENAIKHGLGPLPEGGRVNVGAVIVAGRLRVQVADTGQGFANSRGAGTGLANTRARLASQFGAAASLELALNQPHGVVATLLLPYQPVARAGSAG